LDTFFHGKSYLIIYIGKKWNGSHFGRFSNKLFLSPWLEEASRQRDQKCLFLMAKTFQNSTNIDKGHGSLIYLKFTFLNYQNLVFL
jgi:hypothetical protein